MDNLSAIIEVALALIFLVGVKLKFWTESDFQKAFKIFHACIQDGVFDHTEIASRISNNTKFTISRAAVEVKELHDDLQAKTDGVKKPISKRVQRAGRKLIWRVLDGGL